MGNLLNVREAYSQNEWSDREDYYVQETSKITIPVEPTTTDIMRITSEIDALLSEAMLDNAYIKRNFENLNTKMKLAEREAFAILRATPPSGATSKPTENEIKGLVVQYLKSHPLDGHKYDIFTLVSSVQYRMVFIEAVVRMLSEKKGALISDNGMLKIESSMVNTVPRGRN